MLYITFMSLKSFFPIFHIFRNISTSLFKLYSLCIRADGIVLVTHSRDSRNGARMSLSFSSDTTRDKCTKQLLKGKRYEETRVKLFSRFFLELNCGYTILGILIVYESEWS